MTSDVERGIAIMRAADPSFGAVADTLLDLANDDTVSPEVYERVCAAVFVVLNAWSDLNERLEELVERDDRMRE